VSPKRTALEVAEKPTLVHFGTVVYADELLAYSARQQVAATIPGMASAMRKLQIFKNHLADGHSAP
jgi:hypothetical protein